MKLNNVVNRINGNVDRFTTELEYYVGGEHFESRELSITKRGLIKPNLNILGFKFHFAFQTGDVLFMARNPHLRKAGMVMFDGLCSDASYILRTKDENILSQKYLAVLLQTDHFWDYCESHKVGSVNFAINWTTLANYEFELPSIEEQRVLADKFWAAYELKEAYKKMIAATDEMVKSQFIEMSKAWPVMKLNGHVDIIRGVSYKPSDVVSSLDANSVGILRANNIANGEINTNEMVYVDQSRVSDAQRIRIGDIIVCASSGSQSLVGKAAINKNLTREYAHGAFCLLIRCNNTILPKYLNIYLQTALYRNQIESLSCGSNILNIKADHLTSLDIPIPDIKQQSDFVTIIEQADKSKFELRQAIDKIDKVMKSLLQ